MPVYSAQSKSVASANSVLLCYYARIARPLKVLDVHLTSELLEITVLQPIAYTSTEPTPVTLYLLVYSAAL